MRRGKARKEAAFVPQTGPPLLKGTSRERVPGAVSLIRRNTGASSPKAYQWRSPSICSLSPLFFLLGRKRACFTDGEGPSSGTERRLFQGRKDALRRSGVLTALAQPSVRVCGTGFSVVAASPSVGISELSRRPRGSQRGEECQAVDAPAHQTPDRMKCTRTE